MTQRLALIALPFLLLAACGPVEKKADEAGTAAPPAEEGHSGSVAVAVKPHSTARFRFAPMAWDR